MHAGGRAWWRGGVCVVYAMLIGAYNPKLSAADWSDRVIALERAIRYYDPIHDFFLLLLSSSFFFVLLLSSSFFFFLLLSSSFFFFLLRYVPPFTSSGVAMTLQNLGTCTTAFPSFLAPFRPCSQLASPTPLPFAHQRSHVTVHAQTQHIQHSYSQCTAHTQRDHVFPPLYSPRRFTMPVKEGVGVPLHT